jgi:hypothetical protein
MEIRGNGIDERSGFVEEMNEVLAGNGASHHALAVWRHMFGAYARARMLAIRINVTAELGCMSGAMAMVGV